MSQESVGQSPKIVRRHFTQDEKLTAVELSEKIGVRSASKQLNIGEGNINRWRTAYRNEGKDTLVAKSSRPHRQPRKTSQWIID